MDGLVNAVDAITFQLRSANEDVHAVNRSIRCRRVACVTEFCYRFVSNEFPFLPAA